MSHQCQLRYGCFKEPAYRLRWGRISLLFGVVPRLSPGFQAVGALLLRRTNFDIQLFWRYILV